MHASAFTEAGVVADVNIIRRVEERRTRGLAASASCQDDLYSTGLGVDSSGGSGGSCLVYECEGVSHKMHQRLFHHMDVAPFGVHSPTEVFSVIGRHTNRGLVMAVTPAGKYRVLPPGRIPASYLADLKPEKDQRRPCDQEQTPILTSPLGFGSNHASNRNGSTSYHFTRTAPAPPARGPFAFAPAASGSSQQSQTTLQQSRRLSLSQAPRPSWRRLLAPEEEVLESLRLFYSGAEMLRRGCPDAEDDVFTFSTASSTTSLLPQHVLSYVEDCLEECELWELSLPPVPTAGRKKALAALPPYRVGTRVMARRFGYAGALQAATVKAAAYDLSYTLKYSLDGGVDFGVLHSDIYLVDDSEAHPCGVRDVVTLTLQKLERAVVVEACGEDVYRVILAADPTRAIIDVRLAQVVHVVPLLKNALWSDPSVVKHFQAMDPNQTGFVKWKDVRNLIMHSEDYGLPLSFLQMGELQRELRVRTGRIEPQLVWMASVQEEDMLLDFREFEFIVTRVRNMM